MKFWEKSLMAKMVIYFLLLSILTVVLVAYTAYLKASSTLQKTIFDQLEAIAAFKEVELINWVEDQRERVIFIAQSPELILYLNDLVNTQPNSPDYNQTYEHISQYFNQVKEIHSGFDEIFVLSQLGGQILVSTNKDHEGDYRTKDTFFEMGKQDTFIQHVYLSPIIQKPTLTIATPVYDVNKQLLGVLAVHLNLERMDEIILGDVNLQKNYITQGDTYLVDGVNQLVSSQSQAFQNEELIAEMNERGIHSTGIDKVTKDHQNVSGLYQDYQNISVIGIYRWIDELGLVLVTELPQTDAFAPARELATTTILIGLGSVIVLAMGVYVLSRRIVNPLLAITHSATQVAQGDLKQEVPVSTRDEIGILATAFNAMQYSLSTSQESLAEYTQTLETRVTERTQALEKANTSLSRRAIQLQTSNEVAQQIIYILDLNELLHKVVTLIQQRFGYYFVGIWLKNEHSDAIILQIGHGQKNINISPGDYEIPFSVDNIIGLVCESGIYQLTTLGQTKPPPLKLDFLPQTQSQLTLPLQVGNKIIGALDIHSNKFADFHTDDKMVFQTLANQIAIAMHNAQLYTVEQQRRALAEALERTGRVLTTNLDLHQVPGQILEELIKVVPYERGSILLQQGNTLRIIHQHGFPDSKRALKTSIPIKTGDVYQQMITTKEPVLFDDVTQEPAWHQQDWLAINHSWLGVPLITKDRIIGFISLTRREISAFSKDDAQVVKAFSGQAAIALENASLYDKIKSLNNELGERVKQRTQELEQAYKHLERLDKAKSDFISVTSHELRTPLTVISGYAQIIHSNPVLQNDKATASFVSGIIEGVDRLNQIVDNMLDVSMIDTASLKLHKEDVIISSVVDRIFAEFESALQERKLTFKTAYLDTLPTIKADPHLLTKVFFQLTSNAIKFTPDGGSILISGKSVFNGENNKPTHIEIVISDTGIGIAVEDSDLIFEKFYQTGKVGLHSSGQTKFKGGGPGVGLAIAKGIITAHQGEIWAESSGYNDTSYPGSNFHIYLPIND